MKMSLGLRVLSLLAGMLMLATTALAVPPSVSLQVVASGLELPVDIVDAGDVAGRIYVVEQKSGKIKIVDNGVVQATPFFDMANLPGASTLRRIRTLHNEQGMLSLAFHPQYASNGAFYIFYTAVPDNAAYRSGSTDTTGSVLTVARFLRASTNAADMSTGVTVLSIPHRINGNHNGGKLAFSPVDGNLYLSVGDGGSGGDPDRKSQNTNSLLGKILRINVTELINPASPYTIPANNPFANRRVGTTNVLASPLIWAFGLRNPWRFSFDSDPSGINRGDLFIADVGQNAVEEINYQSVASTGGENYGWGIWEGDYCFNSEYLGSFNAAIGVPQSRANPSLGAMDACDLDIATDGGAPPKPIFKWPILSYVHDSLGAPDGNPPGSYASVTGGFRYRGSAIPALQGHYVYADVTGRVWAASPDGGGNWTTTLWFAQGVIPGFINTFGEDISRELYMVSGSSNILKFVPQFATSLTGVASRRLHGSAGIFDLPIDTSIAIGGAVTVEPRLPQGGPNGNHTIVFKFNQAVTNKGTLSVVGLNGLPIGAASHLPSGNEVIVTLNEGIAPYDTFGRFDGKRVQISLTGVNGTVDASASLGFLLGDTNNGRSTTSFDIIQVRAIMGSFADASNYLRDFSLTGTINVSDLILVRMRSGRGLE